MGLLQDGACTDFFENLSENTLKGDLSNATTFNPPLVSLVDTFKRAYIWVFFRNFKPVCYKTVLFVSVVSI